MPLMNPQPVHSSNEYFVKSFLVYIWAQREWHVSECWPMKGRASPHDAVSGCENCVGRRCIIKCKSTYISPMTNSLHAWTREREMLRARGTERTNLVPCLTDAKHNNVHSERRFSKQPAAMRAHSSAHRQWCLYAQRYCKVHFVFCNINITVVECCFYTEYKTLTILMWKFKIFT